MEDRSLTALLEQLSQTQTALNIVWTVVAAALVMFMQSGFAMVETGFSRTKNVAHTMAMNFLVYSIGILGYWLLGFGLQMGGVGTVPSLGLKHELTHELLVQVDGKSHGLFGQSGFCTPPSIFTPAVAALFMFQMVFMATATTIPTGALVERWKFTAFMLFSFVVAALIYPIYGNWVWGGGFLSTLGRNFELGHGHVDFAGSSVVHMTGGVIAFIGASMVGPRAGKFNAAGEPRAIPAHNIPMVVTGTFVLAFGWFGFNAGSTLSGMDTRLAVVAVNTLLASAAGAVAGALWSKKRFGAPDVTMMCNGMLAGLVSITASCAFVPAWSALLIGAVAGMLVIESILFVERRLRIDDPVGAISVHGVCGALGALSVGLFADGTYGDGLNGVAGPVRGAFFGDPSQLVAQLVGIGVNLVWVGSLAALAFATLDRFVGNRSSLEAEIRGLDIGELGMEGYYVETLRSSGVVQRNPRETVPPPRPRTTTYSGPATGTRSRSG